MLRARRVRDALVPFPAPATLERQRLDCSNTIDGLDQVSALCLFSANHMAVQLADRFQVQHDDDKNNPGERECDQGEPPFENEHCGNQADERHGIEERAEELPGEKVSDSPNCAKLSQHTARRGALEVIHRQLQELLGDVQIEPAIDPRRHDLGQQSAQIKEDRFEQ